MGLKGMGAAQPVLWFQAAGWAHGCTDCGDVALFFPCWKWAPESYHWPLLLGGQEEACTADTVKSAGFTQLGFVTWQTVKYLPSLSVSPQPPRPIRMMKYTQSSFGNVEGVAILVLARGQWGALRQRPLCRACRMPQEGGGGHA